MDNITRFENDFSPRFPKNVEIEVEHGECFRLKANLWNGEDPVYLDGYTLRAVYCSHEDLGEGKGLPKNLYETHSAPIVEGGSAVLEWNGNTDDIGKPSYRLWIRCEKNGDVSYPIAYDFKMLQSPGFTPGEVKPVDNILDFEGITILNSPYYEKDVVDKHIQDAINTIPGMVIDPELSETSEHAVQNKAITNSLKNYAKKTDPEQTITAKSLQVTTNVELQAGGGNVKVDYLGVHHVNGDFNHWPHKSGYFATLDEIPYYMIDLSLGDRYFYEYAINHVEDISSEVWYFPTPGLRNGKSSEFLVLFTALEDNPRIDFGVLAGMSMKTDDADLWNIKQGKQYLYLFSQVTDLEYMVSRKVLDKEGSPS